MPRSIWRLKDEGNSVISLLVKSKTRLIRGSSFCWLLSVCKVTCLLLALGTAGAAAAEQPPPLMHVRVMWMHDPAHQAVVSWSTPSEGASHTVRYDTEPANAREGGYRHAAESSHNGQFTMTGDDEGTPPAYYHHALLQNLDPDTTYYLVVESDGNTSREFHFVTAPEDSRQIKLLFGGDSRRPPALPEPHQDRREMNRRIAKLVDAQPGILALAHGGDYCSRAQWRFMTDWLSDHELTTTSSGRLLPIIPARGNHDRDVVFEEMFFWPNRDHDYHYATVLSRDVVFITLNTEISHAGDQRTWLEAELQEERAADRLWKVVQYHVPAYGSVKSYQQGESQRRNWIPLFEQYGVDLVCEADHHTLKRTLPIFQAQPDPERGIVYVGDGGLGVPQRKPDENRWYLQDPGLAMSAHHVHVLEFSDDVIRGRAIGIDGQVLDEFTIPAKVSVANP